MALEITDANFEEMVMKADKPVLVDFWAEWCGPCRMVGPVVEEISKDYEGKAVVGIAKVVKQSYQDPTTDDTNWLVVDLEPVESLKNPVTLEAIKADARLQNIGLVKQGRLSVMGMKVEEFDRIVELGS
jgi:thiol-disulfide isomerase/thioredoxin